MLLQQQLFIFDEKRVRVRDPSFVDGRRKTISSQNSNSTKNFRDARIDPESCFCFDMMDWHLAIVLAIYAFGRVTFGFDFDSSFHNELFPQRLPVAVPNVIGIGFSNSRRFIGGSNVPSLCFQPRERRLIQRGQTGPQYYFAQWDLEPFFCGLIHDSGKDDGLSGN